MLAELKREVGRLVVQATATVTGKILTPEDQRRLAEETAQRQVAAVADENQQTSRNAKPSNCSALSGRTACSTRTGCGRWCNMSLAAGHRDCPCHPCAFLAAGETRPRPAYGHRRERRAVAAGLAGCRPGRSDAPVRPGHDTSFAHRPALIGGMRIQVGSDVYDGSVRAGAGGTWRRVFEDEGYLWQTYCRKLKRKSPARRRRPPSKTSASSARSATASPRSKA